MKMALKELFNYNRPNKEDDTFLTTIRKEKKIQFPVAIEHEDVYVGVEVEVERVFRTAHLLNLPSGNVLFKCIEDGSLRNSGKEFVSIPLRGQNIPFALTVLHKTLTSEKNCVGHEFTDRTSVHVHMDVQLLSFKELANLILTYIVVEPLLYNFVGGNRHNNIFCVPLNLSSMASQLHRLFGAIEIDDAYNINHTITQWPKYTGFNLKPVSGYGTVEFRHMVGTNDVKQLSQWINLLLRVRAFSVQQDFLKLKERILSLNTTSEYRLLTFEIFGTDFDLIREDKLESHMEDMVIFVKDIFSKVTNKHLITKEVMAMFAKEADELPFVLNGLAVGFLAKLASSKKAKMPYDYGDFLNWLPPDFAQFAWDRAQETQESFYDPDTLLNFADVLTPEWEERQQQRPRLGGVRRADIPPPARNIMWNFEAAEPVPEVPQPQEAVRGIDWDAILQRQREAVLNRNPPRPRNADAPRPARRARRVP
jgi:hypothetical protein